MHVFDVSLISYCRSNNGLIILTMDEGNGVDKQHIATILVGANVAGGRFVNQVINHYNVTKTITDNFGAAAIGHSVGLAPLTPPRPAPASVRFQRRRPVRHPLAG